VVLIFKKKICLILWQLANLFSKKSQFLEKKQVDLNMKLPHHLCAKSGMNTQKINSGISFLFIKLLPVRDSLS
jgi:ribosomal protein L32